MAFPTECSIRQARGCVLLPLLLTVAKTQNPLIHDPIIEEVTIHSLVDFLNEDWDETLICPLSHQEVPVEDEALSSWGCQSVCLSY